MGEPGRIRAFLGWWHDLSTGWRVNAGLYVLAGLSLIALLAQLAVGGSSGPRRVEVAAGRTPPRPTTTLFTPSTTAAPTTTVPPLTTAPAVTSRQPSPATTRPRATSGGSSPTAVTFAPSTPTSIVCEHNTTDERCGPFSWDPPPGANADLTITVEGPTTATVGSGVVLNVRVTDPDHLVTGNCTTVDWGDGAVDSGGCQLPTCPNARGVWDTPPKQAGHGEAPYQHTFTREGTFTVTFTFRTDEDRCPDPYGSQGSKSVTIRVSAPAP